MNEVKRFNNHLLRESKIVIPASELNPRLISHELFHQRMARILGYATALAVTNTRGPSLGRAVGVTAGSIIFNPVFAKRVQKIYADIDFSQPIFFISHEHKYPEGWISAKRIRETHPIYYIDMKGNLVFLKPSRAEYYRYLFQKSTLGKLGYNTWWLRGYLEPPKAPESVKKWASEKLKRAIEQMRTKPVIKPALVRVNAAKRRELIERQLRRRTR